MLQTGLAASRHGRTVLGHVSHAFARNACPAARGHTSDPRASYAAVVRFEGILKPLSDLPESRPHKSLDIHNISLPTLTIVLSGRPHRHRLSPNHALSSCYHCPRRLRLSLKAVYWRENQHNDVLWLENEYTSDDGDLTTLRMAGIVQGLA